MDAPLPEDPPAPEPAGAPEAALPRADVPSDVPAFAGGSPAALKVPARRASRWPALAIGLAFGVGGGLLAFRDRGTDAPPEGPVPAPAVGAPTPSPAAGEPPAASLAPAGRSGAPPATRPTGVRPADGSVVVVGSGAAAIAAGAQARAAGGAPGTGRRFSVGSAADARPGAPLPAGARALIAVGEGSIVVVRADPAVPEEAPDDAWATPAALVADVLTGLPLSVSPTARAPAVAAAAAVLAGDGRGALAALEGASASVGVRVLRAWGAALAGDGAGTHAALEGLGRDPEVGPTARFLTGCALLAAGSAKEALRDFEAAVAERPAFWPANLMAGVANEALDLEDHADAAYAAVLAVAPGQPTARLRRAALLATPAPGASTAPQERETALRRLESLVAERPRFAAAWGALARLRARGATSEDVRGTAAAFQRVAALREDDPRAWSDLVAARAAWARAGGGAEAYAGAVEASARWTALAPDDGLAWYDRGALLHQWALDFTAGPMGARSFRERMGEARLCYGKALGRGLEKPTAALVHRNLGFLLEVCPRCGGGLATESSDLPATAAEAFEAALALDPSGVGARLGLVATRIAARDAVEATRLLGTFPAGADADPREKETLLAAARRIGAPSAPAADRDPLPDLCRTLMALGYRRVAVVLLDGDTKDATRLSLRCRARAFLYDVEGLTADLALLAASDPAAASDLRSKDPVVRAALTP